LRGCVFFSVRADATLIDHGSYVQDTASGLDWLKLDNMQPVQSESICYLVRASGRCPVRMEEAFVEWCPLIHEMSH